MPAIHRPPQTADRVLSLLGTDPFRVSRALTAGFTEGQLRAALGTGLLERLRPGVLALPPAQGADLVRRASLAALLTLGDRAVVSHTTAGHLHRLPTRRPHEKHTDVVVSAPVSGRRRAGLHVIQADVPDCDTVVVSGVRCTSLERTALDLARRRRLSEALVVLDPAVGRRGRSQLLAAVDRLPGFAGLDALRSAIALADPRSESPLESASRGEFLSAGLPAPELQAWIVDDENRSWRVDMLWEASRLVGEADGWGKYASMQDIRDEKRREDALRRAGYGIVRWTSDELWGSPETVIARVTAALGS